MKDVHMRMYQDIGEEVIMNERQQAVRFIKDLHNLAGVAAQKWVE